MSNASSKPAPRGEQAWLAAAPAVLMMAWGGNQFTPLLLLYRKVEGYSALQVDLFFGAYIIGLIPGFLIAGSLSDRFGRKPLMIASVALSVAAAAVLALGSASPTAMMVGRLLSGVSVAVAMVVGTTWIRELSTGTVPPAVAARRASLTITAGFLLGAVAAGLLAQWAPWPTLTPYIVQLVLTAIAAAALARGAETAGPRSRRTRGPGPEGEAPPRRPLVDVHIAPEHRRRFFTVVLPMAPWVFAAPALAFAVSPAIVVEQLGGLEIAFAALLTLVTLTVGFLIQPSVPRIAARVGGASGSVGLIFLALGTLLVAGNVAVQSPLLACAAGVLLGGAYGICMLTGLVEVQAMAGGRNLAGLTGLYYALTYIGFALPAILSALAPTIGTITLLVAVAALALGSSALVALGVRRTK
ncbi:MFS transporter [Pseudoclavibacter sp. AY1F1]|uniref:MFS transporter n=1 Tax=Pseudoclavibacter sp. AY1F1 TaxID=2080583 RepID=UPI000CE75CE7|nr:MFS transporter [Pseudoclavibacter sp. AY1F1]PPF46044.1 MFS transporter [Pseudoclavibacter sp. AY1F1]